MPQADPESSRDALVETAHSEEAAATGHEKHCFVVMPSGRDHADQKWFRGWYEVVIKPAVIETGYVPILAAAEEQPGAINDEIRTHLALDAMVVVDLAGAEPEDDPNPNVMYELGIRHALDLPLVMMAWKGQRLPFDVGNQRAIMEDRDLLELELNRKKLVAFIHAAREGRYYRPMQAVARMATIEAASESLEEGSLLRVLAQEVRDLRTAVTQSAARREPKAWRESALTVKKMLRGKVFRKELYPNFVLNGGDPSLWARVLKTPVPPEMRDQMLGWGAIEWTDYAVARMGELKKESPTNEYVNPSLLAAVRELLPKQPWPSGMHREVASKLGMSHSQLSIYIRELIRLGEFQDQVDGELLPKRLATRD